MSRAIGEWRPRIGCGKGELILMLSWPVFWAAVTAAFVLGGTFGVMILSLCVVAGDADRQMERDLEERRCSEEVDK
jgi:hypothetical protein